MATVLISSLGVREGKFYQITCLNYSNSETAPLGLPIFFYEVPIIISTLHIYFLKKSKEDFRRKILKRYFGKAWYRSLRVKS